MQKDLDPCVLRTLEGFQRSAIIVIEWETPLLHRLGYPLAPKPDLLFLIPDEQIQQANDIATASGLKVAGSNGPKASYLLEYANQGSRYVFGNLQHKFILAPLSWTGVDRDQLEIAPTSEHHPLPCTIFTMPLPVCCAAYLRILSQDSREGLGIVRAMAIADLAAVICYSMFDMEYDGDYMICPEDEFFEEDTMAAKARAEKEELETQNAIRKVQKWPFKDNEGWIRETLLNLVSGKLRYEDLPSK